MPDLSPSRVFLVGMMGSGKTTIGRLLSERTGWPYVDNDELVRRLTGRSAREVLAEHGVSRMRDVEEEALSLGVKHDPPVILGVAAGTITSAENRTLLDDAGIVVWLRADPATLVARASGSAHRPFVDAQGQAWLSEASSERAPLYASVADVVVDTAGQTPQESVDAILAALEGAAA